MRLYCVRHGESVGNLHQFHQYPDESLTEIGIDQARFVAHRFTKISIDCILSSDLVRAKQTAKIIQEQIHKPIEYIPLLQEMKKPTVTLGKRWNDPESIPYYKQLEHHKYDPDWHYSDEENYFDVFYRTREVLKLLENRPEKNILIVSHGIYLQMFHAMMLFPDKLNLELFERYFRFSHIKNTAITVYEQHPDWGWQMVTWNDIAHLG